MRISPLFLGKTMSLAEWYNEIPPVTRVLFTSSFAFTLLPSFKLLPIKSLLLDYAHVVKGFEVRLPSFANIFKC